MTLALIAFLSILSVCGVDELAGARLGNGVLFLSFYPFMMFDGTNELASRMKIKQAKMSL